MNYRNVSGTDLSVSEICLGTMTFGTPVEKTDAIRLIHYAMDQGINFIDTANMYEGYARKAGSHGGVAEEIIGEALKGRRREDAIIATKVGMKVGEAAEDEFTSPAAIRKQLDVSLQRLQSDYIDIYYLHKPDPVTPIEDILVELEKMIQAGKIKHYAVSNYDLADIQRLVDVAEKNHLPKPIMCQPPLSLLKQEPLEDLLPYCSEKGISVVPYQILQGGLLSGKYKRGLPPPAQSRKAEKPDWLADLDDELYDKLEQFSKEANARNQSLIQYAISWCLGLPAVTSAIIGVKNESQIDEAVAAVRGMND